MPRVAEVLRRLGVHVTESGDGDKHVRPGWVGTTCPWCRGRNHLGWTEDGRAAHCWQCGRRDRVDALARLAGLPRSQALAALIEAREAEGPARRRKRKAEAREPRRNSPRLPDDPRPLDGVPAVRAYLERRRFDPSRLEAEWDVSAVGPWGGRWKFRVLVPITHGGRVVTWQARAIRKAQEPKYLACPPRWEARPIRSCLYGLDRAPGDSCVLVEGVTDVWRLGPGAIASFGLGLSPEQRNLLAGRFRRVAVLRDPGGVERWAADAEVRELALLGLDVWSAEIQDGRDPGDLGDEDARWLARELMGT